MTQQNKLPNVYQLAGDGIQITYTINNINDESQFDYQDAQGSRSFTGNQVFSQTSSFGGLITVFLDTVSDFKAVTLTLVLPSINMDGKEQQSFETLAILTTNINSIAGPPPGADQTYQVYHLKGTVQLAK